MENYKKAKRQEWKNYHTEPNSMTENANKFTM